jgi:RNA polymerase subunit RPABC4/transcription elongation factor Spt4
MTVITMNNMEDTERCDHHGADKEIDEYAEYVIIMHD